MNRLSQLLRPQFVEPILRKKISGVNMIKRKELRRLKKLNTFSRQFTGEQNQHGWFTPKRYKALGTFLEGCRNVHPGALPIKDDLRKQIGEKFVEDSHWNYYNFRNIESQYLVQQNMRIAQLPAHFRDEFTKQEKQLESTPKVVNPLFIYNAQYNIYMPQDERQRLNLLLKIENPPLNKDEEQEQD